MGEVRCRDPRTGTVYVYSSHSYWDKQTKTKKSERKLIGKLDDHGNVVPTKGHPGRNKKDPAETAKAKRASVAEVREEYEQKIAELRNEIHRLQTMIRKSDREKAGYVRELEDFVARMKVSDTTMPA